MINNTQQQHQQMPAAAAAVGFPGVSFSLVLSLVVFVDDALNDEVVAAGDDLQAAAAAWRHLLGDRRAAAVGA